MKFLGGGGFQIFFIFTPTWGKDSHFWLIFFSNGLKPPTRKGPSSQIFGDFGIPWKPKRSKRSLDSHGTWHPSQSTIFSAKWMHFLHEKPWGSCHAAQKLSRGKFGGCRPLLAKVSIYTYIIFRYNLYTWNAKYPIFKAIVAGFRGKVA